MRSINKDDRGKNFPPLGYEPLSLGTKSQCANNELNFPGFGKPGQLCPPKHWISWEKRGQHRG